MDKNSPITQCQVLNSQYYDRLFYFAIPKESYKKDFKYNAREGKWEIKIKIKWEKTVCYKLTFKSRQVNMLKIHS